MVPYTGLTRAQHVALDEIADRAALARVVGWSDRAAGPVVVHPTGWCSVVLPGGRVRRTTRGAATA